MTALNCDFWADPSSELACHFPGGAAAGAPRGDGRRDDRWARYQHHRSAV